MYELRVIVCILVDIVNVGNARYESIKLGVTVQNKLTLAPGICTLLKWLSVLQKRKNFISVSWGVTLTPSSGMF